MIHATVFGENRHEQTSAPVRKLYPRGMHTCIAEALGEDGDIAPKTVTQDEPEHGLTASVLAQTDVLLWWGHVAHAEVDDRVVDRVQARVLEGMGLIVLHSGHHSKIFRRLMGTTCSLSWREAGEKERLWTVHPGHPIAAGVAPYFELQPAEMYGEPFRIPEPDELVFLSWFQGGEVFRSGCTFRRGNGKIFYFRPGHETYPIYHDVTVRKILRNAVRWARQTGRIPESCPEVPRAEAPEPF